VVADGALFSAIPLVQHSFSEVLACSGGRGRDCFRYRLCSQAPYRAARCPLDRKSRPRLTGLFFATQFPRASIMTPSKLTPDTQADLFAAMLQSSAEEVRRVLERAGGSLQARSTPLLSLPSEMAARLTESLPNIKGVDLTGFAKFFLYVKRYFGWRVESQVGFCPATKSADGSPLTPAHLVASATLRSAWKLRDGPWPVDRRVEDQYDIDAVAFAIAVRIMGINRGR